MPQNINRRHQLVSLYVVARSDTNESKVTLSKRNKIWLIQLGCNLHVFLSIYNGRIGIIVEICLEYAAGKLETCVQTLIARYHLLKILYVLLMLSLIHRRFLQTFVKLGEPLVNVAV